MRVAGTDQSPNVSSELSPTIPHVPFAAQTGTRIAYIYLLTKALSRAPVHAHCLLSLREPDVEPLQQQREKLSVSLGDTHDAYPQVFFFRHLGIFDKHHGTVPVAHSTEEVALHPLREVFEGSAFLRLVRANPQFKEPSSQGVTHGGGKILYLRTLPKSFSIDMLLLGTFFTQRVRVANKIVNPLSLAFVCAGELDPPRPSYGLGEVPVTKNQPKGISHVRRPLVKGIETQFGLGVFPLKEPRARTRTSQGRAVPARRKGLFANNARSLPSVVPSTHD